MKVIVHPPWASRTFARAGCSPVRAIGGDASDTVVARRLVSEILRAEDLAETASSNAAPSTGPGAFAPASAPRTRDRFRDPAPLRPPRGFVFGRPVSGHCDLRASMSSTRLKNVNPSIERRDHLLRISSKYQHHGRTSHRASCNRIVNPRARPKSLETSSLSRRPAFDRRAARVDVRGRFAFAARRSVAIFAARATTTTTPCYPDSIVRADTLCRKLVMLPGTRVRGAPAFVLSSLARDVRARPQLREGVFTNLPGQAACLGRLLLQDFE